MVEQEALGRFRRVFLQAPGALLLADGVPGPDGVFLGAFHRLDLAADLAVVRLDPDPVEVLDAHLQGLARVHVHVVLRHDLTQPHVLRIPRVVHEHRALGQREEGVFIRVDALLLKWFVPHRQRVEVLHQPLTVDLIVRLRAVVQALSRQAEFLQRLGIELHDDGLDLADETDIRRHLEVVLVGVAHVLLVVGPVVREEALVLDVLFPLVGVRLALQ